MELFDIAFSKNNIYYSLFFNIKSVTQYPDVYKLKINDPALFKQWEFIARTKYKTDKILISNEDAYMLILDDLYKLKGVYYPEFSKIVSISHATVNNKNNKIIRNIFKFSNEDEFTVIKSFNDILMQISSDGVSSSPEYFPTLCGHNIINNDIPLFLKRLIYHKSKFTNQNIVPYILKKHLKSKPWDANVFDTLNLWKFNGISNTPLVLIGDFMGLKRSVDLMEMDELSKYYWDNIESDKEGTLNFIGLQAATQVNLVIQMMNEIRIM